MYDLVMCKIAIRTSKRVMDALLEVEMERPLYRDEQYVLTDEGLYNTETLTFTEFVEV